MQERKLTDPEHESKIEKIAALITQDRVSLDEQDPQRLAKYYEFAESSFHMDRDQAKHLVNEAFLYLMLKDDADFDVLEHGGKFGAGFS